jgi:SAM-dependent methyltransferase
VRVLQNQKLGGRSLNLPEGLIKVMPRAHFVEDYERLVDNLLGRFPLDEAMSKAVGGSYDRIGALQVDILTASGLSSGMSVLDLGCGSGRTASHIAKLFPGISYVGIDVVQRLLDYAATKCPPHFRFVCHQGIDIPLPDGTIDIAAAFSLFTHLLHEETFCYLQELRRVLKPNAVLIISFLEFSREAHWSVFEATVGARKRDTRTHLNIFIDENTLGLWASKIGFTVERIDREHPIGQTLGYLRRDGTRP